MLDPKHPSVIWASLFGIGFIKPAPGTWGSVAAVLLWWFFLADLSVWQQLSIASIYFLTGWWASHIVAKRFQVDDASQIVADEVVGMWLTLIVAPKIWWVVLLAFLIFRLLDILKPGPIGWLDRHVKGGLGVMLDDVLAGLVGAVLVALVVMGFTESTSVFT